MVLLRQEVGDALRQQRQSQGRTLREVSSTAAISLGYLSEVERGEKEASSELLAAICAALDLPMSALLLDVQRRVALTERVAADVVPVPLAPQTREQQVSATAA